MLHNTQETEVPARMRLLGRFFSERQAGYSSGLHCLLSPPGPVVDQRKLLADGIWSRTTGVSRQVAFVVVLKVGAEF